MNRLIPLNLLLACLLAAVAPLAIARSSDRHQPMTVEANSNECNINDGTCVFTGNVIIQQGTLDIRAARAEVRRQNGDISLVILTGKQVQMKQILDDGTPMDAAADRIEYDTRTEIITLIDNYVVKSPSGDNRGQRLTYNTRTGQMQGSAPGSRVRTTILPKSTGEATAPAPAPAPAMESETPVSPTATEAQP